MKLLAPKFEKSNTGGKKILKRNSRWAIRLDFEVGTKSELQIRRHREMRNSDG
jgi:hypothetical protein